MAGKTWARALDAQLDVLRVVESDPMGNLDRYIRLVQEQGLVVRGVEARQGVIDLLKRTQGEAPTYWVSPDMCDLWHAASHSFKEPPVLHQSDVFSGRGFAWFAKPFMVTDPDGERVSLRAVTWAEGLREEPRGWGCQVFWWSFKGDDDDYTRKMFAMAQRRADSDATYEQWLKRLPDYILDTITGIEYGKRKPGATAPYDEFAALQFLLSQKVATVSAPQKDRATFRRAQRFRAAPDWGTVRLITLRRSIARSKDDDGEHYQREWSHRWWVNGYWATRHTREGPRTVWVSGHVKGPDDAPFIPKDDIYVVKR